MDYPYPMREMLRLLVEDIFVAVTYPGDDRLVDAGCDDPRIEGDFKRRHWKKLTLATLLENSQTLFLFTPEAFRFYLPAYLHACVLHHAEAGAIPGSVYLSLAQPSDPALAQRHAQRVEILGPREKRGVMALLLYLKKEYPEDNRSGDVDKAIEALKA